MLDKLLYEEEVKRCMACFEQQFHYGVFYAYMKLREQEIRNVMWISECVAQVWCPCLPLSAGCPQCGLSQSFEKLSLEASCQLRPDTRVSSIITKNPDLHNSRL